MNIFRSEDHVQRWLGGRAPGATLTIDQLSELAHAWWSDRLAASWRPRTRAENQCRAENQRIIDDLGLAGDFWRLP